MAIMTQTSTGLCRIPRPIEFGRVESPAICTFKASFIAFPATMTGAELQGSDVRPTVVKQADATAGPQLPAGFYGV
jgi:hypothetical protein